ncbi:MAG: class II aldolase/adducin family protein [Anaerohalosphaeraceae bacterium]
MLPQALHELIQISCKLGADRRLVWKGGGNISIKTDDGAMYIKASGSELGKMTRSRGWRKVDIAEVVKLLNRLLQSKTTPAKISKGLLNCCDDDLNSQSMPSIETFFHALLGRCVIHLHPVYLLPYLCSQNGRQLLQTVLKDRYDLQWIPFRGLGVVTAGQIQQQIQAGRMDNTSTTVLFLSNHGLIVSCDNTKQAQQVVGAIIKICRKSLPVLKPVHLMQYKQLSATSSMIQDVLCIQDTSIMVKPVSCGLIKMPGGSQPAKEWFKGAITPEEITYLAGGIVWIEKPDIKVIQKAITRHRNKTGQTPMAFYVNQQGLVIVAAKKHRSLLQAVFLFYLQIRSWAMWMKGLKPLSSRYLTPEGMI